MPIQSAHSLSVPIQSAHSYHLYACPLVNIQTTNHVHSFNTKRLASYIHGRIATSEKKPNSTCQNNKAKLLSFTQAVIFSQPNTKIPIPENTN